MRGTAVARTLSVVSHVWPELEGAQQGSLGTSWAERKQLHPQKLKRPSLSGVFHNVESDHARSGSVSGTSGRSAAMEEAQPASTKSAPPEIIVEQP